MRTGVFVLPAVFVLSAALTMLRPVKGMSGTAWEAGSEHEKVIDPMGGSRRLVVSLVTSGGERCWPGVRARVREGA